MSNRLMIFGFLLLILTAAPACADVDSVAFNYVNLFNKAHKEGDEQAKDKYFDLISDNDDILNHVKEKYPTTYTLIRLEKTKRRLDTIKFRLGDAPPLSSGDLESRRSEDRGETKGVKSEKRAGTTNRKLAQDFPNQERPPNRTTSGTTNSNVRTTNRDTVQAFNNQDRVRQFSNQKRLRQQRP